AVSNGVDLRSPHGEHLTVGNGDRETARVRTVERAHAELLNAHRERLTDRYAHSTPGKGTWVRAEGFVRHAVHPGSARGRSRPPHLLVGATRGRNSFNVAGRSAQRPDHHPNCTPRAPT